MRFTDYFRFLTRVCNFQRKGSMLKNTNENTYENAEQEENMKANTTYHSNLLYCKHVQMISVVVRPLYTEDAELRFSSLWCLSKYESKVFLNKFCFKTVFITSIRNSVKTQNKKKIMLFLFGILLCFLLSEIVNVGSVT